MIDVECSTSIKQHRTPDRTGGPCVAPPGNFYTTVNDAHAEATLANAELYGIGGLTWLPSVVMDWHSGDSVCICDSFSRNGGLFPRKSVASSSPHLLELRINLCCS